GELVAAAPVELLDRADEPERALLDQVEEGQALVAVVLGDRDDEPEVRLDHPLLRAPVAALDRLRELDLLGRRQERVAAGLAEEELERVGGRLPRERGRGRRHRGRLDLGLLDRVHDHLDRALLELAEDGVDLERVELERLEHLVQLGLADAAALLRRLEQSCEVVREQQDVRLARHPAGVVPAPPAASNPTHENGGYVKSRRPPPDWAQRARFFAGRGLNGPGPTV